MNTFCVSIRTHIRTPGQGMGSRMLRQTIQAVDLEDARRLAVALGTIKDQAHIRRRCEVCVRVRTPSGSMNFVVDDIPDLVEALRIALDDLRRVEYLPTD